MDALTGEDFVKGLEFSKYVNVASPIAAGWGATMVYDKNPIVGTLLIAYVVVWSFANATGFVVTITQNWRKLRKSNSTEDSAEESAAPE